MPINNMKELLDETRQMNQLLDEIQLAKRLLERQVRSDVVLELIKATRPEKDK